MVNNSIHPGQPISDSLAVVKVGNMEGVDVYHSNTPVDKTNSRGEVLLNRVQSYEANKIFINDKDLSFGYNLKGFTKHISPPYRSGSFVEFEVEKMQAITGNVFIMEGGEKKPVEFWQLIVNVRGESIGSPIVRDGEYYP